MRHAACLTPLAILGLSLAAMTSGCTAPPKKDAPSAAAPTAEKIKISRLDELPQHTYPYNGQVVALIRDEPSIRALAADVRADIQADLNKYEINDRTTLQRMYGTLLSVDLINRNYAAALARIAEIRALEEKEAVKLTTGLVTRAMIAARREVGPDADEKVYRHAFREHLAAHVAALPWDVVQDEIQQTKGRAEIFGESLVVGIVNAQMQPTVDKTGELNADQAAGALGMHLMLRDRLPLKEDVVAVLGAAIAANQVEKPDIWAARDVALSPDEVSTPVLLGVWDSGTDPRVFQGCLWHNPDEVPNGADDDGNGWIDDIHGIAYDIHANHTTGLLYPLGDAEARIERIMQHMKGFTDLQAAIDSPEASALKQHLSSMPPEDVQGFIEDLSLCGNYAHGTHVAGIMTRGNPAAELLIARLSYDHRMVPVARTVEWGQRDAGKCRETVEYFKNQGVRVVNMSWGEAQEDAESSLERNGVGENAGERREIAREVFRLQKNGLYEAIRSAPGILFVCAAGNADNDVEFDEYIPSSFDLPNLMTVGAVDQAGDPTSFTSFGPTVEVYANGFEVESYVPGGDVMNMSGTSMASPQVANLAGKILALKPDLRPQEVIEIIRMGSDRVTDGDHTFLLLNPKRTIELVRVIQ